MKTIIISIPENELENIKNANVLNAEIIANMFHFQKGNDLFSIRKRELQGKIVDFFFSEKGSVCVGFNDINREGKYNWGHLNDFLPYKLNELSDEIESMFNRVLNEREISSAINYKEKYEKCINVIKRFDAGIIGMYDL